MPLIAFQHRARHFHGVFDAAFTRPAHELRHARAAIMLRVLRRVAHAHPGDELLDEAPHAIPRHRLGFYGPVPCHHRPPFAACTTRFSLVPGVVIFSRSRPISPFRRASTGDSSPVPPPDTPRTWARLDP